MFTFRLMKISLCNHDYNFTFDCIPFITVDNLSRVRVNKLQNTCIRSKNHAQQSKPYDSEVFP